MLQPEEIDLEQSTWLDLLNFRVRVENGQVDVEGIRGNVVAEEGASPSVETVKAQIRTEFDLETEISDPTAERALEDALDALANDDHEGAAEALEATLVTPCEETTPEFTDHGDGHESACLLHDRQHQRPEVSADD